MAGREITLRTDQLSEITAGKNSSHNRGLPDGIRAAAQNLLDGRSYDLFAYGNEGTIRDSRLAVVLFALRRDKLTRRDPTHRVPKELTTAVVEVLVSFGALKE